MHGRIALVAAMLLAGALPATASADEAVGERGRTGPAAAYGGWEAWPGRRAGGRYEGVPTRAGRGTVGSVQP